MSVLLVTYDLNKEPNSDDYNGLLKAIKSYGSWARLSESSYAISTADSPSTVFGKLSRYLDRNDCLLVITLRKPYDGRHSAEVINWLSKNLT